jgi:hypothetical protein
MSDKGLADMLSCVNAEPKSVLLTWCLNDQYQSQTAIWETFESLAGDSYITRSNIRDFLMQSLIPANMAQVRNLRRADKNAIASHYAITEQGREAGIVSAFSMKWAVDHNLSVYRLLGSKYGDSCYVRFRILEEIEDGMKCADIEHRVGLRRQGGRKPIVSLAKSGVIIYEDNGIPKHKSGCFQGATISLAPDMREAIQDYVVPLRELFRTGGGPVLEVWKNFGDPKEYARKGVALYSDIAAQRSGVGEDGWRKRILAALKDGDKRQIDLVNELGLPEGRGWCYLKELTECGLVQKRKEQGAAIYALRN